MNKKIGIVIGLLFSFSIAFAVISAQITTSGGAMPGNCQDGYVVQNTTTGGVDCVSVAVLANLSVFSGNQYGYVTGGDTFHINISALNTIYNSSGLVGLTCLNGEIAEWQSGQWVCGTDSSGLSAIYSGNNLSYISGGDTVNVNASYFDLHYYPLNSNPSNYLIAYTETDPSWTANSSTVARTGICPPGSAVQNTTTGGVQCVAFPDPDLTPYNTTAQLYTLFVNQTYFADNITQYYLASNPANYISSYTETDPSWTANSSTVARIGTCLSGYVVQNTTTGGVQCVSVASLANVSIYSGNDYAYITGQDTVHVNITQFDIRYVNQTYYDSNISLYYPASNPAGYINVSQVPQSGINETFANATYARLDTANQPFTGNISAIKVSPSNTSWGQCWNGTDYITGYLVGINCV